MLRSFRAKLVLIFILLASVLLAEVAYVYVTARQATVRPGKSSLSGAPLGVARYGERLKVLAYEAPWYQVEFQGRPGYIHEKSVSSEKPAKSWHDREGLGVLLRDDASAASATAGARGLLAERYAQEKGQDITAVDRMEKNVPAPEELDRFQREARLGEYQE